MAHCDTRWKNIPVTMIQRQRPRNQRGSWKFVHHCKPDIDLISLKAVFVMPSIFQNPDRIDCLNSSQDAEIIEFLKQKKIISLSVTVWILMFDRRWVGDSFVVQASARRECELDQLLGCRPTPSTTRSKLSQMLCIPFIGRQRKTL